MKIKNILILTAAMTVLALAAAFPCLAFGASEEPVWFSNFAVCGDTVYIPEGYESFVSGMKQHEGLPDELSGKVLLPGTDYSMVRNFCFYGDKIYYRSYPEAGAGATYTLYSCDLNGKNDTFIADVLGSFICDNTLYYCTYEGEDENTKIVIYKSSLSDLSSSERLAETDYFSTLEFLDSYYENIINLCYFDGDWLYYTIGSDFGTYSNKAYYKIDPNGNNLTTASGKLDEFSNSSYIYGDKTYYFEGSTLYEKDRNGGNAVSLTSVSSADADNARILEVTEDYVYYSIQNKYVYAAEKPDNSGISVILNGEALSFDQEPAIIDGRTMVPLRAIFEAMGYTVDWDQTTQTAEAVKGADSITVQLNNSSVSYTLNGEAKTYTCDTVPQAINGRTLVPVRAIAECAGCEVNWDSSTKTVTITS